MFAVNNYNFDVDQPKEKKTGEQVYFEGNKKNQLNQIKSYLKNIVSDPEKEHFRKELIKKIIGYTTSGVDTSRLYPEMVMASATKDIIEKKLIYMYLSIYSSANENFARMAINTFIKDSTSPNPNFRSLAIRHLSNLRFQGRDEYVMPILKAGLTDFSPLVKKSSIMGLTKILVEKNRFLEEPIRNQEILNLFYEMIRQSDMQVVCTAIEAINQIEPEGIAMSKKLANYLLAHINNFGEFQLPPILNYLDLYEPKTQEEIFHLLNTLQPKLKMSAVSVCLGVSKIYLKLIKVQPSHAKNIMEAIKTSILSFLNNDSPEIQYIVLKHIEYIIQNFESELFTVDFKKFLIGGNEPTYLKIMKIRIMRLCIRKNNMADIINEFAEYLTEEDICGEVIDAFSRTLFTSEESDSKFVIKTLIKVIENSASDFLCNNALPLIRNFLRKYPQQFKLFSHIFYVLVKNVTEDEARCAMIEIIGDYGEQIEDAIELITWSDSSLSDTIKISLLRANVKLFFKRPQEMFYIVSHIFDSILKNDDTHLQIKDYAAFLYRGLQADFDNFKKTFMECRTEAQIDTFIMPQLEFNSLEIIYGAKQDRWIVEKNKYIDFEPEMQYNQEQEDGSSEEQERLREKEQKIKNEINVDSKFNHLEAENFDVTFTLTSEEFENSWENFDIGSSITRMVKNVDMLSEENMEDLFKAWNITVIASSEDQNEIKLYLFCKVIEVAGDLGSACMEFCILKVAETLTLLIKSDNDELAGFISKYIEQFLKINEII